tara:strand:+ start:215 stop:592 length:378 start_codon:yes stop_codon:yes gene_type:complete
MMSWFDILKRTTGFFNIFNTTDIVREATAEWSESIQPGVNYHQWLIRKQVAEILLPKLKQIAKEEGLSPQSATLYVKRNFDIKDAERSIYDKTIYNSLKRLRDSEGLPQWRIKGQYAKAATYVKL